MENEFLPVIIPAVSGFQHDLDDPIHHIAVEEKAATEAESYEDGLLGVVRCDISVADSRNRIYSPVK